VSLRRALSDLVGPRYVLSDPDVKLSYERDWTGRYQGSARLVVQPADASEVARVMEVCARYEAAIVPQGGNTGLVGGSVPRGEEIVLSLRRLAEIGPIDMSSGQVTVGAGVTLAALHSAARSAGQDPTLDFGARESCTMGGIVACDAGGSRALRHGTARAHVAGLEAVLANGEQLTRLAGLPKDNAGYDIPSLIIGSEGTLAIITQVRWRLSPLLPARVTALVPVASTDAAVELLAVLRAHAPSLESCDFFLNDGLELVLAHQRRRSPLARNAPLYVLLECASRVDPIEELVEALAYGGVDDALIADDTASRRSLWSLRDGHADAINAAGVPHKLDVGVPLAELGRFLDEVPEAVAGLGADRVILFGHLGDGNVHVNVLGAASDDARVDDAVLELVLVCGGTISAEHGIGVAKVHWLERARGQAEVEAMRAIKRALDPDNLLNPGAVLPGG
jgi:FAD/FMN-containing dehydrogenase